MCVRLERSVQHLAYSRNRTVCMNATRRFNHSRSRYVRKKVAYIELLFLSWLDRAILRKGLNNRDSFLEFPFGHGGSKTLSDVDNQSMVGRCKPEVSRSETNARTRSPIVR